MTKYLGMSDIFIIFVSRKGNNRYKKIKKKVRNIWILHFFIVYLYCKKEIIKNKILWHRKNLNLK